MKNFFLKILSKFKKNKNKDEHKEIDIQNVNGNPDHKVMKVMKKITVEESVCHMLNVDKTQINEIDFENVRIKKQGFIALLNAIMETYTRISEEIDDNDDFDIEEILSSEATKSFWVTDDMTLAVCVFINKTLAIYEIPKDLWDVEIDDDVRWN